MSRFHGSEEEWLRLIKKTPGGNLPIGLPQVQIRLLPIT